MNIELTSYCSNDASVQGGIIFRAMDCGAEEYLLLKRVSTSRRAISCVLFISKQTYQWTLVARANVLKSHSKDK